MAHRRHTGPALLALAGLLLPGTTWARQNIAIGEITIGYDYQERKYDNEGLEQALPNDATGDLNGTNAEDGPEVETSDTESPSSAEASSSSGDAVMARLRLARCAPMAKRCTSSRSRCR